MSLHAKNILLTGASSGIGRCTALELAKRGARLTLVGRDAERLEETGEQVESIGSTPMLFAQDLSQLDALSGLVEDIIKRTGPLDVLINNAGVLDFTPVEMESLDDIQKLFKTNLIAPVILSRELVRHFKPRHQGHIVNIGSIFGSIGFAYFATYSSSKFALRGYSEALRRELFGTGVQVTYVAPRATRTRFADLFGRMAQEVGMKLDEPEMVARKVVRAVERSARDRYLGFPEGLFVRINALWPRLVDAALRKQNEQTRPFAEEAACANTRGEV